MIEVIKAILIAIGFIVVAYMFSLLLTYCAESVGKWRKNGCKIKCLCKHEYDVEFANSLFGEISLKCRKCGKKKIIKNLSSELVDKLWWGGRDEEKREVCKEDC